VKRIHRSASGRLKVVASMGGISQGGNGGNVVQSTSSLLGADLKSSLLDGILEVKDAHQLQAVYRDIYMHDPICGSAVDLKANLPWSDFTLTGASDEVLDVFNKNLQSLNVRSLHSELSVDRMVTGAFTATLIFDAPTKSFKDLITHDYADIEIQQVPLYSQDPIIRLNVPKHLKDFANDKSDEAQRIQNKIPPAILDTFRTARQVDLEPASTLYLPRNTLSTISGGVSYYRRVLHIYLLERLLYRGTLTEATRRQRSTLQITAGDEEWSPTKDDYRNLVGLFQRAEQDPISSIIATHRSVQAQEIRPAGDFWKWTDISDQLGAMKLIALGINDAFLSGDASYNTMESAMSVFVEDMKAERDTITQQLYYNKIFPLIAALNGFAKESKEATAYLQVNGTALNDTGEWVIPQIDWHKKLQPDANTDYMAVLDTLTEKGVPISLRMWAAAGNLDIDNLVAGVEADSKLRDQIKEFGGGSGEDEEFASANIITRDYGTASELYTRTKTGKKKHVMNQRSANAKQNEQIAKALRAISDPETHKTALKRNK